MGLRCARCVECAHVTRRSCDRRMSRQGVVRRACSVVLQRLCVCDLLLIFYLQLLIALDPSQFAALFASVLFDRRIVFISHRCAHHTCHPHAVIVFCAVHWTPPPLSHFALALLCAAFVRSLHRLGNAALGLESALRPMQWPHVFVPVLPAVHAGFIGGTQLAVTLPAVPN